MSSTLSKIDSDAKLLSEFGLTPYQSRVYLAIVKLGLTTVSRIAKLTGIRREEVYRTLPKLEQTGLIERVLGRPVKVRGLPLDDALSLLIKRKKEEAEEEIQNLTAKKEDLLTSLDSIEALDDKDEDDAHFILTADKDSAFFRTSAAISHSRRTIDIIDTNQNIRRFLLTYMDELTSHPSDNFVIRIMTDCLEDVTSIPKLLEENFTSDSYKLRYTNNISASYILFDKHEAIITTANRGAHTDGRSLWTDDSSLVSIIQRDFEELFHSATDWKTYQLSSEDRMAGILSTLKPREHVILVYNTLEAKRDALFRYIQSALENGEAARYVCSEETPNEIRRAMKDFGINVEENEESKALGILDYTDVYIKDNKFNIDDVMRTWGELYNEVIDSGFKGMRVTGEMNCFLEHGMIEELIEYEQALHTILDIPMIAICAYNAERLQEVNNPINIYYELVKAHGRTLYVDRDNRIGEIEIRA
jgi:hypothetical protein